MNKFSLIATAFLVSAMSLMVSCSDDDDDKTINFKDTPANVQTFVSTHFADVNVSRVEKDTDSYDVKLSNGFELEFYLDGEWKSVDGGVNALPQSVINLLPVKAIEYVNKNHANRIIGEIESRRPSGYKVDFIGNPDLELIFDKDGNFVGVDN